MCSEAPFPWTAGAIGKRGVCCHVLAHSSTTPSLRLVKVWTPHCGAKSIKVLSKASLSIRSIYQNDTVSECQQLPTDSALLIVSDKNTLDELHLGNSRLPVRSTNTFAHFLPCLLGLLPGDLKHDGWRAVDIDERPVQFLLQLKLALSPCNIDILHARDTR